MKSKENINLELGNLLFNSNENQPHLAPTYLIALLKDISNELKRIMWNVTGEEYDSPFENTGNSYKNNTFEVQSYNWDDEETQSYNFKYKDIKISWYKYLRKRYYYK